MLSFCSCDQQQRVDVELSLHHRREEEEKGVEERRIIDTQSDQRQDEREK